MNLTLNGIIASSGGGPVGTYSTVLARASSLGYTTPSAGVQTKQSLLIDNLKAAGLWDKLDLFYVMAGDGDSNFACLNWVNPSLYQASKVNSPTYTSLLGFSGNGSTAYLDTNWNVTLGTKLSQDNIFHGILTNSQTPSINTGYYGGGSAGSFNMANTWVDGDKEGSYAMQAGAFDSNNGPSYSFRASNRVASSAMTQYLNISMGQQSFTSATPVNSPIYIMARGVPTPQWHAPSTVYFKINFWGSAFNESQVTTFRGHLNDYIASL